MATLHPTELSIKTIYTFEEAIEYIKRENSMPTNIYSTTHWYNIKTGKEVIIGITNYKSKS